MRKTPSNSLAAKLKPKQLSEVLHWLIVDGKSEKWVCDQIHANCGINCSVMSVSRLLASHGLQWRMDRAAEAAEISASTAPKDLEEKISQGIKQATFARVFEDLTVKELVALERVRLAKESLEHEREKFKASLRTKMESGLEALFQEIKDNPKALAIFEQLKETLAAK